MAAVCFKYTAGHLWQQQAACGRVALPLAEGSAQHGHLAGLLAPGGCAVVFWGR